MIYHVRTEMRQSLVLVNRLGSMPRNSVDRLIDWLNMTLLAIKPQNKQKFNT